MSGDQLQVELVAADRTVWSGQASRVIARTTEGDVGVLAHHAPLRWGVVPGVVYTHAAPGDAGVGAVDGGFLSVANNQVRLLCEYAELSHESNYDEAKRLLEERKARDEGDADAS